MTADIINLRDARKRRDRARREAAAAENRHRHGASKGERVQTLDVRKRIQKLLDQVRREDEPSK